MRANTSCNFRFKNNNSLLLQALRAMAAAAFVQTRQNVLHLMT